MPKKRPIHFFYDSSRQNLLKATLNMIEQAELILLTHKDFREDHHRIRLAIQRAMNNNGLSVEQNDDYEEGAAIKTTLIHKESGEFYIHKVPLNEMTGTSLVNEGLWEAINAGFFAKCEGLLTILGVRYEDEDSYFITQAQKDNSASFAWSQAKRFNNCSYCFKIEMHPDFKKNSWDDFEVQNAVDVEVKYQFSLLNEAKQEHICISDDYFNFVPFDHKDNKKWINPFEGIQYYDPNLNFILKGAPDVVLRTNQGKIVLVDIKVVNPKKGLDEVEARRQLSWYAYIFSKLGFPVHHEAFVLKFMHTTRNLTLEQISNGQFDFKEPVFNPYAPREEYRCLPNFIPEAVPLKVDTSWIEPTLFDISKVISDPKYAKEYKEMKKQNCNSCHNRILINSIEQL